MKKKKIGYVEEASYYYRRHDNSVTSKKKITDLEEVYDLVDKEDWVVISWIQDGILNISERRYDDRPIEVDTELEIDNCPMCGQKL